MIKKQFIVPLFCVLLISCGTLPSDNASNTTDIDEKASVSSVSADNYDISVSGAYGDFDFDNIATDAVVRVVPAFGDENNSDNFLNSIFGGKLKNVLNSLGVSCSIVDDERAQEEMVNYDYMFSIAGYDLYTYETGGGISRITILIDIYQLDTGEIYDMHIAIKHKANDLDTYTKSINNVAEILGETLYTEWTK